MKKTTNWDKEWEDLNINGCKCAEMTCPIDCENKHTHKGFSCHICKTELPDSQDTVDQVKSWNRLGKGQSINWTLVVLSTVLLGVVVAMISYDVTPFLQANDIFLICK